MSKSRPLPLAPSSIPSSASPLQTEPAPWRELVLICGKCMKKQEREPLRGELRRALKAAGRRDLRVVATGCMDLCPKDGVAIATLASLTAQPARLWVLGDRQPVDAALVAVLGETTG